MRRMSAILSAAALGALGLTACSESSVFEIEVGACAQSSSFAEAEDGVVGDLPLVDCAEPHDLEAFATMEIEDDELPDAETLETTATDFCIAEFEGFVGLAYDESELALTYFAPTEDSWERNGDREVLCWVQSPEDVTGTLKDAAR